MYERPLINCRSHRRAQRIDTAGINQLDKIIDILLSCHFTRAQGRRDFLRDIDHHTFHGAGV